MSGFATFQWIADIAHLYVIPFPRQNLTAALGSVAIVVTDDRISPWTVLGSEFIPMLEIGSILHFLLSRQFEEFSADGELTIDFFLGQTKASDVEEADIVNSFFELRC